MRKSISRSKKPKNHSKQIYLALLSVILVALTLTLINLFRPQPLQIAEINSSGSVILSLDPASLHLTPNSTTTVTLNYNSPTDPLSAVQVELSYDPALLLPSDIIVDPAFPTSIIAPTIDNGKINFVVGIPLQGSTGLIGSGKVASFTLKALGVGTSSLAFTTNSIATTINQNQNMLKTINNIVVDIANTTNPTSSISPSSTPSPSVCTQAAGSCYNATGACVHYTNGCERSELCQSPIRYCNSGGKRSPSPSVSPSPSSSHVSPSPSSSTSSVSKPPAPTNLVYNCYNEGRRITLRWNSVNGADSYLVKLGDQSSSPTRNETDLDITPNTSYIWTVTALDNGVSSDTSRVDNIKCSGGSSTSVATTPSPTPTSTPTPTPTPAPTKKSFSQTVSNIFKPKSPSPTPSPSLKSSPVPLASFLPSSPISSPGSLADIFASPSTEPKSSDVSDNTSFIAKIFIGWRALFIKLVESITR